MKHLIFILLLLSAACAQKPKSSDQDLVYWNTPEGVQRLSESQYKVDFFELADFYRPQPNGIVCGPTSGSIVLNALRQKEKSEVIPLNTLKPKLKKYLPEKYDARIKMYTPENFVLGEAKKVKTEDQIFGKPIKGKKDYGLQIRQFHKMLQAHKAQSVLRVVDDKMPLEQIRQEMMANLITKNDFVIVNYKRKFLGQKGGGHISPLGAYHKASDSFLIMDVNRSSYGWVWVKTSKLVEAMRSFDTVENRGYVLVKD